MNIGIIGSGVVAQTLGSGFIKYGNKVTLGTRNPSKLDEWKSKNGKNAEVSSFSGAADFGEIVILAVKGTAAEAALKEAGVSNLKGKTIIDTTNPIEDAPPVNGVLKFFSEINYSLMERLQSKFPDCNFVKAFSCIGSPFMVNPDFGGIKPSMFICGNNEQSKNQVKKILDEFGFETEDMGMAEAARAIEPLCILWCIPGLRDNKWSNGFKLLKK